MTNSLREKITVISMAVAVAALTACVWFLPAKEYSSSERRLLAQKPAVTLETIKNGKYMKDLEDALPDQFPARDTFRGLKAFCVYNAFFQKDNNGLYKASGSIVKEEYPMNEDMLDIGAQKFEMINNKFLTNCNVVFSIVPDKNYFTGKETGRLSMDYEEFIRLMTEKTPFMKYVDITELLTIEDYYSTDSHWSQEKLLPVADRLVSAFGQTMVGDYEERELDSPFYGVYAGQYALPVKPDTIRYLYNDVFEEVTVKSYKDGKPVDGVIYNYELATGKDPYDFFLSGADPIIKIENPSAPVDRQLVVFRDSYGSSLSPLFVQTYSKVTVVDIRYVNSMMLNRYVNMKDSDVLFIYSTTLLNNSVSFK